MSNLLQKIKVFYDKFRIAASSYKVYGISPSRDWRIILISTIVTVCVFAFSAFYFYIKIDSGEIFNVKNSKTDREVKIDKGLFKKVVDDINFRQAQLEKIKNNPPTQPDPSL